MSEWTSSRIRSHFLDYFARNGHRIVPSSPVYLKDDPTLLFANAGMNQFKRVFLGQEKRDYKRAASSQKCIRVSGKHNDLENVGRTSRHHTFFEMLGNFSFGDYFKEEAIKFCWELMVKEMGLPVDRVWVTVFREDDEAMELWKKISGLGESRIFRRDEKDNFWSMGDTGPCGPCSEIGIDQGEEFGCGRPGCTVGCDCDRYLELWNLVFMQYDRDEKGNLNPLPRPSIDTGMGLERIAAVLQGKKSNFETDLFVPLIEKVEELSGRQYQPGPGGMPHRVIVDHVRALVFSIGDGVMPSNDGRGYVLRLILRRAARYGRKVGLEEPFLWRLAPVVAGMFSEPYPELNERLNHIVRVIRAEEENFSQTFDRGQQLFERIVAGLPEGGVIPGKAAFELHDTYGFLIDILVDMARERGFKVDREGFDRYMMDQRARARRDREEKIRGGGKLAQITVDIDRNNQFRGYEVTELQTRVAGLVVDGKQVGELTADQEGMVYLADCPFYAERGGQVGDTGELVWPEGKARVVDTQYDELDRIYTLVRVEQGRLTAGGNVTARVDIIRRRRIERNHTATHLLHQALRQVLGKHVRQSGSLVSPERLRFDFIHFNPLAPGEIREVESLVNQVILEDRPVEVLAGISLDEALKMDVVALFDEKYDERVRVVTVRDFSRELCGGTHVRRTGEIGLFRVVSETGVAAGIRRIEAVTGDVALKVVQEEREKLGQVAAILGSSRDDVVERLTRLLEEKDDLEKELADLRKAAAESFMEKVLERVEEVDGVRLVRAKVDAADMDELREMGDSLRRKLPDGVGVLAAEINGKAAFVAVVGDGLKGRYRAGELVKKVAEAAGGGGGGKDHLAQAGAKDPGRIGDALREVPGILQSLGGRSR